MRRLVEAGLILWALPALVACGSKTSTNGAGDQNSLQGAALWRIEATVNGKDSKAVSICADNLMQKAFLRPSPEVGGQACEPVRDPAVQGDFYAVRCRVGGKLYSVEARNQGDLAKDFTVDTVVKPQATPDTTFRQVRHYVRTGACPAGWRVGDSAAAGDTQVVNATSGAVRPLDHPFM